MYNRYSCYCGLGFQIGVIVNKEFDSILASITKPKQTAINNTYIINYNSPKVESRRRQCPIRFL